MDHATMPDGAMPDGAMDHMTDSAAAAASGTALPAGDAPPPPIPTDHYADRTFAPQTMASARHAMMRENGGQVLAGLTVDLAEAQLRRGQDGYRWAGEARIGGDLHALVIASEGEGSVAERVERGEVQALYARAIGPYFDLRVGVRHDFAPDPATTYAAFGVEGLAPYWIEVAGAVYLGTDGDVLGRVEAHHDARLTQRLILQPRIEVNFAMQNSPAKRVGAGLSDIELGLRLRYEIDRRFAPYLGVSYEAKTGRSADYARAAGEAASATSLVAGVRVWF